MAIQGASPSVPVSGVLIDETNVNRDVWRAFGNATQSGNNEVVAPQTGLRIRVLWVFLMCAAAVTVKFQGGTTDIAPACDISAKDGFLLPFNPHGWFETAPDSALNVNLSGTISVGYLVGWIHAK